MFEIAKELYFHEKVLGKERTKDKSPAVMASGICTIFLPKNPNEPCDKLNWILQKKQAGNHSAIKNEEFIPIADTNAFGIQMHIY